MADKIDDTANVMAAYTITRAQLLLQYYAALSELEAEARAGEFAEASPRFHKAAPIFFHNEFAALAGMGQAQAGAA